MNRPTLLVSLTLCTLTLGAAAAIASPPAGLAGEVIVETYPASDPSDPSCGPFPNASFQAYLYFGEQPLDPGDTLTVDIAVLPFSAGETFFGLDGLGEIGAGTFLGFSFADGRVNVFADGSASGLSYNRFGWNDVTVLVRPATQDFILTVNGEQTGPVPFADFCLDQGGCHSAQALRMHNFPHTGGAIAWIDTLSIATDSASGHQLLASRTFDTCTENGIVQTAGGVLVAGKPPVRVRPKK